MNERPMATQSRDDIRESKFDTFFTCMDCGPLSWKKAWEINDLPIKSFEDL